MKIKTDIVSLFQVPLQCLAAPEIACGGRARPILLALESYPGIAEAWVNRAGSIVAVVGSKRPGIDSRTKIVESLFEEIFGKDIAKEIVGKTRETQLARFISGDGWYRSGQTISLSVEEADIIAGRLVRRIQSQVPLTDETARALETGFAEVFKRQLIGKIAQPKPASQEPDPINEQQRHDHLVKTAREHLNEAGMEAFHEALARGYRPQLGEK